jgi:hypothetical protein
VSYEGYLSNPARQAVCDRTGVVIPVHLADSATAGAGRALLADTVGAYVSQVSDPGRICLSVDGESSGSHIAQDIAERFGTGLRIGRENRGKLAATIRGVRDLLETKDLAYVAIVDQDGDHFANELPNLARTALHIVRETGDGRVLVLGQRSSRWHPMGFLRGELEEFANRVLLDALAYRAAVTGRPLTLEYAVLLDDLPDFHSGYKLFDRTTAERVFAGERHKSGVSDECYYRHACEAVMVVEALESGARLGAVRRSTLNGQPISVFGRFAASRLTADMILWPCHRLDVPLEFVEQWMLNHASRLRLATVVPEGRAELERVHDLVMRGYGASRGSWDAAAPLFV